MCERREKRMDDFCSHNAILYTSSEESQWKTREARDKMLQWSDLQKQRERAPCLHDSFTTASTNWQQYLPVFTGDRRLTGSCNYHAAKWHLTQTPNRLRNISRFSHMHFFRLNCAQIKTIPSGGDAKLTAYPSSLPRAATLCSHWFFFTTPYNSKRKSPLPPTPSSLQTSTLSSCLQAQQTKHTL